MLHNQATTSYRKQWESPLVPNHRSQGLEGDGEPLMAHKAARLLTSMFLRTETPQTGQKA